MSNSPDGPKIMVKTLGIACLDNLVKEIIKEQDYKDAVSFRQQIYILLEKSRQKYKGTYKLTYKNVADLFDVRFTVIKRQYANYKAELLGKIKANGRPFSLTNDQLELFSKWYKSFKRPPTLDAAKLFLSNLFHVILDYRAMENALSRTHLKKQEAEAIDKDRYECSPESIDYYYDMLFSFFSTNNVPSYFVFNVDEEGHDEFVDAKKYEWILVPEDSKPQKWYYPVERKDDHTTFLACIAADGSYLKPLIVVKRTTIEARVLRLSLFDKVMIEPDETGYINSEIFNEWIDNIFIPEVQERRKKFNYDGPAVLILDGCSSHYTEELFNACEINNIKLFFLPPHSSNQTQMLDLGMFHLHKQNVRKARLSEVDDDDALLDKIQMLLDSFQRAATYSNVKSAFEAAGVVYELIENSIMPIVQFSKDFTTRLLHCQRTLKEKIEIRKARKGRGEVDHRIRIKDFNDYSVFWPNPQLNKIIKKMPKIIKEPDDLHSRILNMFIKEDEIKNDNHEIKKKKGRPRKEDDEKIEITEEMEDYMKTPFNDKLRAELIYAGFLGTDEEEEIEGNNDDH